METRFVDYRDGDTALRGYVAHDTGHPEKRPAVLVAPAFAGRDLFAGGKAEAVAQLGYVGFALDPYGKGIVGATPEESGKLMAPWLADRAALRRRLMAAVETVRSLDAVDPERVAAIGFCFGGLCVLDLARSGADLRGVCAFHGLLAPPKGLPNEKIRAKVLALHGWDDPMVPPEMVLGFAREMDEAGADWQLHAYGGVMHAFTNPRAADPGRGTVYDEAADRRSWETMRDFLAEVLR